MRTTSKYIFAIHGVGGVGKTTTVRRIYEQTKNNFSGSNEENLQPGNRKEVYVILKINDWRVGFVSRGDPGSKFPEALGNLVNKRCHIIVCATRTRGESFEAVENLRKTYHLTQYPLKNRSEVQNHVTKIVAEIRRLVMEE